MPLYLSFRELRSSNGEYISHAEMVVAGIQTEGSVLEFVRRWRQHFLDSMKPQFLPRLWCVEHNPKSWQSLNCFIFFNVLNVNYNCEIRSIAHFIISVLIAYFVYILVMLVWEAFIVVLRWPTPSLCSSLYDIEGKTNKKKIKLKHLPRGLSPYLLYTWHFLGTRCTV